MSRELTRRVLYRRDDHGLCDGSTAERFKARERKFQELLLSRTASAPDAARALLPSAGAGERSAGRRIVRELSSVSTPFTSSARRSADEKEGGIVPASFGDAHSKWFETGRRDANGDPSEEFPDDFDAAEPVPVPLPTEAWE